jgi:hypothetical protein
LLERLLNARLHPLSNEVATFIHHYLEILKEATGMDIERNQFEELARQLYRDHRGAIDFIVKNGKRTEFGIALQSVFGDTPSYPHVADVENHRLVFHNSDANRVSFLPESWFEKLHPRETPWPGCENWWAELPLIAWIQLIANPKGISGQIRLTAEVGPLKDHSLRVALIHHIENAGGDLPRIGFQAGAKDAVRKYSRFLKKGTYRVDDVFDQEKIAEAIKLAIKDFGKEFQAVADCLPAFLQHDQEKGPR